MMTDNVAPSTAGPQHSTPLPIDDHLRAALALLRHACDCAQDAHAAPWDFALEIGKLYEAGLSITGLRWLVATGLVEHGDETSVYGDDHRSFTRSEGLNFLSTTCVVLTKKGAAFARQVLQASAATQAAAERRAGDEQAALPGGILTADAEARISAVHKPQWDPTRRQLSLGGRLVKRFRVPARNQELILSAFQEQGWPEYIDDPLTGQHDMDPKTRLNDVIYRLNHKQIKCLIRFHASSNGTSVRWSFCNHKTMRQGPSAAN